MGTYKLADKINLAGSFEITGKNTIKAGKIGSAISKNGVSYTLNSSGELTISPYAANNKILKGTKATSTVNGTANSDFFDGCGEVSNAGTNDTIEGKGGHDIVVYSSDKAWGQDVINKTNGTMTIVFSGYGNKNAAATSLTVDYSEKENGLVTVTLNTDATGDDTESTVTSKITINGWNDKTHKIVYNDDAYDSMVSMAKASGASKINSERNELWKAAGLIASA